jgi:flagellar protein FliL
MVVPGGWSVRRQAAVRNLAMGAAAATVQEQAPAVEAPPAKPNKRRRLLLLAAPVLLGGLGAGLWFSGVAPRLLGLGRHPEPSGAANAVPVIASVDLPDMVANLNAGPGRRASFIKLHARIELARAQDVAVAQAGMPRLLDLFQTYLREMRPEDLRGSMGTWRLREELIARANIAIAPARVTDVLFTEMLVQ